MPVFGSNISGLEALDFQVARGGSPLAMDLVACFQRVMNLRDSITSSITERVKKITDHTRKVVIPELKDIIKKHTGMEMAKCHVSSSLACNFAMYLIMGDDSSGWQMANIMRRYSGLETLDEDPIYSQFIKDPITAEEMIAVADSFNKKTGYVSHLKVDRVPAGIKFCLFFDPYAAFLIKEVGNRNCEYLTSVELAAIILHEIGHAITTLELGADLYLRAETYRNSLAYFLQKAPREEKAKYTTYVLQQMMPEYFKQVDKKIGEASKTRDWNKDQGSIVLDVITLFFSTVISTVGYTAYFLIDQIDNIFTVFGNNNTYLANKKSDFYRFNKNPRNCEQIADEYVGRHGMSRGLVGGLQKLYDWCTTSGLGQLWNSQTSKFMYYADKVPYVLFVTLMGDVSNGGDDSYDKMSQRFERAYRNTLGNIKKLDIPPEMLEYYVQDAEQCERMRQNAKPVVNYIMEANRVHEALAFLIRYPFMQLGNGEFERQYEKRFLTGEKLQNNDLFLTAGKLRVMSQQ